MHCRHSVVNRMISVLPRSNLSFIQVPFPVCENMEVLKLHFRDPIKEEPLEFISVPYTGSGFEMDLSSTVKIEETNMDDLKTEELIEEKMSIPDSPKYAVKLMANAKGKPGKKAKYHIHPRKLIKIAEDYKDLYSQEICRPSPFRKVLGLPIIQCPACKVSASRKKSSAFLDLLLHVTRRHSTDCRILFSDICERYRSIIECMRKKITARRKNRYCLRSKTRKNLLEQ